MRLPVIINVKSAKLTNKNTLKPYNNSTPAQCKRVLEFLIDRPQSTFDLRNRGIMHPGGRIKDLREAGYKIVTHLVQQPDENNVIHRIALYALQACKDGSYV